MAPRKGTPSSTPGPRKMTRPSAMRKNLNPSAADSQLPTIEGANEIETPSRTNRRANTRATLKPATSATGYRRTPAKATPSKSKTKATPAKQKAKKTENGNGKPKGPAEDDEEMYNVTADEGAEDVPENDNAGSLKAASIASSLSLPSAQSITTPPGVKNQKARTGKRKPQLHEDKAYVDEDISEDDTAASPTPKAAVTPKRKAVPFGDRPYRDEAEPDEEHDDLLPKAPIRKRKARPVEDQNYRYDENDEVDQDINTDIPRQSIEPNHLTTHQENYKLQEQSPSGQRNRVSPTGSSLPTNSRPPATSDTEAASQKARTSGLQPVNGRSPKRQRTRSPSVPSPSNTEHPSPEAAEISTSDSDDPIKAAKLLFVRIQEIPRSLDLDEISALFMVLQEQISMFCKEYFNYDLTPEQEKAWPMHLLGTKYKRLMEVTQFIADGSGCGWRNFFTKPEHRRHLVHGILGEWFQQRIFKHTAFSIPEHMLEELEDIDREYLRYDAFVRNKKKAAYMENSKFDDYFPIAENHPPSKEFPRNDDYKENLDAAARDLASEFLQVLEPLLPPPCFDPLVSRLRQSEFSRNDGDTKRNGIYFGLIGLIKKAASLHHCIRFAGTSGLVVRIAPHVRKGTIYTRDDADRNICVNADWLNDNVPHPTRPIEKLMVKMTCFGRVEAVWPHGLDQEQTEQVQTAAQAAGTQLTKENAERKLFPLLPYELQQTDAGRNAVADLPPVPGTEWDTALHKSNFDVHVDKRFQREVTPDMKPEPVSYPFVTIYPRVAPANLYCEWVPHSQAAGQSQPQGQTLSEAVQKARWKKFISCGLKDAWNTVTDPYFVEWAAFCAIGCGAGAYGAHRILGDRHPKDVLTSIQNSAAHACSSVAAMGSGASAYISQLLAPTATASSTAIASAVTASRRTASAVTASTTTTIMQLDVPLPEQTADVSRLLEEVTSLGHRVKTTGEAPGEFRKRISPEDPIFSFLQTKLWKDMGIIEAVSPGDPTPNPTPNPTPSSSVKRSKVL